MQILTVKTPTSDVGLDVCAALRLGLTGIANKLFVRGQSACYRLASTSGNGSKNAANFTIAHDFENE
jgi:hypothetical protein